jgi:RNA polymerase sigma-70 factor (ECF subfamily)
MAIRYRIRNRLKRIPDILPRVPATSDCGYGIVGYEHSTPVSLPLVSAPPISDSDLMRRVQAGDPRAFRALYDRHVARALGAATAITRNGRNAEDAVQDAFLDLWRSRAVYEPGRGSVAGWLLTIVRNRALDVVRRVAARERPWDQLDDHELPDRGLEPVEAAAARREDVLTVRAALRALPHEQATALGLAYFAGLSQTEIATRLDVPLGTIKSRMRLGMGRLARELEAPVAAEPAALPVAA